MQFVEVNGRLESADHVLAAFDVQGDGLAEQLVERYARRAEGYVTPVDYRAHLGNIQGDLVSARAGLVVLKRQAPCQTWSIIREKDSPWAQALAVHASGRRHKRIVPNTYRPMARPVPRAGKVSAKMDVAR